MFAVVLHCCNKDKERPEMTLSDYEMTSVGTLSSSHPQAMMLTSIVVVVVIVVCILGIVRDFI